MRRCTATARRNGTQSCLFRCEALAWSGICTLNYLVDQHDFITNWDDIEQIWYHTCHNEFHVDPQKHPVLLTEAPHNSKSKRQKMAEIMFEDSGHVYSRSGGDIASCCQAYYSDSTILAPGVGDGIIKELSALMPSDIEIKVVPPPEKHYRCISFGFS
ncbi:hypothetical protein ES319_D11G017200v1 [Gossypium barbadense]|uniref:Uncharacterized protein n=2 Tax=Gossypium TaxID=3633 RepID=A0A5J5P804_GOSBA|nr:hypothetical protein ES319_D11G017200v1 [Gossypium barbadense]TYG43459.1 hypothetical protein ES288_D11G018600v1 [Gossypium darwinii]